MGHAMKIFRSGNKKGIALIYIAILIVALIGFLGLVIDIGYMYVAKGQLQNAADAAALAGAAKLRENQTVFQQYSARFTAKAFASKNFAAREAVQIAPGTILPDGNPNALSPADVADGNDITIGNWNFVNYSAGRTPINAIQVRTRRTVPSADATSQGQISTFLGRIFSLLPGGGIGFPFMGAGAEAIAVRQPLKTPGISICIRTCDIVPNRNCDPSSPLNASTADLILQKDHDDGINNGMAWTAFGCTQAPQIGPNGDVADRIWDRGDEVTRLCDLCITTNNGIGAAIRELEDAFNSTTFDPKNKKFNANGTVAAWTVAVPVIDFQCNAFNPTPDCLVNPPGNVNTANSACPPGRQGHTEERYHVQQVAIMRITSINNRGAAPTKGITIDCIKCIGCPTDIPLGKGVALVR